MRERTDERPAEGEALAQQNQASLLGVRKSERHTAPGRGRGKGVPRRDRGDVRRDGGKLPVVTYGDLEEIDSASDWENDDQLGQPERTDQVKREEPVSTEPARRPRRDDRQGPSSSGTGERDWRREKGGGRGRGRGRPVSDRPEQTQPGGGRRGGDQRSRDQQSHEPRNESTTRSQAP